MLSRLTDRFEEGPDGEKIKIVRYGLWGTTSEIERRGRKWFVVHPNKKEKQFKSREEAELYLEEVRRIGGVKE